MSDRLLAQLEAKLNELIHRYKSATAELTALHEREQQLQRSNAQLLEQNRVAEGQIAALSERLQTFEKDSQ